MLLPLDRVRRDLKTKGIPLAMSYLVTQIERAADLLGAVDGEHWKQLLGGDWMATDATGLKVLIPDLPGSHNGHLEVYRRDELVVFQYEASKDSATGHSIDAEAYLIWAFTRLGTHRDVYNQSAADLTPAAYLRAKDR